MKTLLTTIAFLCLSATASAQLVDSNCEIDLGPYPEAPDCPEGSSRQQACVDLAEQAYFAAVYYNYNSSEPTAAGLARASCLDQKLATELEAELAVLNQELDTAELECYLGDDEACARIPVLEGNISIVTAARSAALLRAYNNKILSIQKKGLATAAYLEAMANCCAPNQ